jgi:putative oxidoreductase
MTTASVAATPSATKGLNIALWIVQVLLALAFLGAGLPKLLTPIETLAQQGMTLPPWLPRFIGVSEVAGALGLILPAATRIKPVLTPVAAVGLAVVMVLATGYHVLKGEWNHLVAPIILLALSLFVAWGRLSKAPISAR